MTKVLLHVDDSDDERFLFRRSFDKAGLSEWQLRSIAGGQETIDHFKAVLAGKESPPALALLDLKMPAVDGFGVLDWLRKNQCGTPAVVLSSSELTADHEKAMRLGARACLAKKKSFAEVLEFVRDWRP